MRLVANQREVMTSLLELLYVLNIKSRDCHGGKRECLKSPAKILWILSTISNQKRNYTGTMYTVNDSRTPKRRRNNTEGHMTPVMAELPPPHWLPGPMPPPNGRYPIPPPLQTHQPLPYAQVANNAQVSGMTDSDKLNFLIEKNV